MKILAALLSLFAFINCFASEDKNIIAISEWSKPVSSPHGKMLRARMVIAQGYAPCYQGEVGEKLKQEFKPLPETQFYLDLQNMSCKETLKLYYDPYEQIHCTLLDTNGKPPPPQGRGGSGGGAGACWVTLPYDSTIRLRSNMFGYGRKPGDGLQLTIWPPRQDWIINPKDTNTYYLSGTLTVTNRLNPFASVSTNSHFPTSEELQSFESEWSGTIDLPKLRICLVKP